MNSLNAATLPRFLHAPGGGYVPPQAPPPAPPAGLPPQAHPPYPTASTAPPVQAQRGGPELIYAVIVTLVSQIWGKIRAVFTGSPDASSAPGPSPAPPFAQPPHAPAPYRPAPFTAGPYAPPPPLR